MPQGLSQTGKISPDISALCNSFLFQLGFQKVCRSYEIV